MPFWAYGLVGYSLKIDFLLLLRSCTDVYKIMLASNVNWDTGGMNRQDFLQLDCLEDCVAEMWSKSSISEEFYDSLSFPEDMDSDGNLYPLTNTRESMARSMPLYTPDVLKTKMQLVEKNHINATQQWQANQTLAQKIMLSAADTLQKMKELAPNGNLSSVLSYANLDKHFKLEELQNFVRVHKLKDPTFKITLDGFTKKGKPLHASIGTPCLLLSTKQVSGHNCRIA
jgi:hypothetical protein